ncbi:MAG: acetyl-CoA decarbonylase/synthase complex subunit alpha/beta [Anaerolineae bacterium]
MSKYIATAAIRGAHDVVYRAEKKLQEALSKYGPDAKVEFTNTAYYLPIILGLTGIKVATLGDMPQAIDFCKKLLHPVPNQKLWLPYLGDALDAGIATLMAEELLMGIGFAEGTQPEKKNGYTYNGPIDDIQLRSWGIQLVDGRMPGFAAVIGRAKSNQVAVQIVRELQRRNILVFLSSNVDGVGIVEQLLQEGVELGYDTYTVPFGSDTESTCYALGFATRSALTFGGLKGGQAKELLEYNEHRTFAFALALGPIDDLKYATAAGAVNYGFPAIADTRIPNIFPSGLTLYEAVVSMPFDEIEGRDDLERADRLVQKCIEVRGVKLKITEVPIPVPYGSAFEGEVVRRANMRVEFGGKYSRCFEYLHMLPMDEVEDHKIEVIGPGFEEVEEGGAMDMGILVQVAGRKMQEDFEPVLERQIHYFINGASGVQHIGQRDIAWIRVSKAAAEKGFNLKHFGEILYARFHADFGAIVDKVQVKIITEPKLHAEWLEKARQAYNQRNVRMAGMTDESVDTFYSCTLCQSFAPNHVCVVSPERLGLCGAYNWLDCKASHEINPTGPNQPIIKGECFDPVKGYFKGVIEYAKVASHGTVEQVSIYSIMENPMTACGCFECIMMVIPEANGFMIVSREDPSMTPAGMTFSTLAGMAGGGLQTPGVMGIGKYYITSKKFIPADGGFKRVVWMSSFLKDSLAEELKEVCIREGDPDLLEKIADERVATTVEELLAYLEEKGHPALTMPPLF